MEPKREDWKLSLSELESQQLQMLIGLELNRGAITRIKKKIKEYDKV